MSTDTTPSSGQTLLNGIELTGSAASKLKLDLTDPVAVLALKLVADGTGAVRQRAAKRAALLQQLQSLMSAGADLTSLQSPDAIPIALARIATAAGEAKMKQGEVAASIESLKSQLGETNRELESLTAKRKTYSAVLWWLGIGWLLWKFSGKQNVLDRLTLEGKAQARSLQDSERERAALSEFLAQQVRQDAVLRQIVTLDAQPIELLRGFGWSHVPFKVSSGLDEDDRLIFASLWARNFAHEFPDIDDGLARVEALRASVLGGGKLPVLLSPTTDESDERRGMLGEELMLAKNIDTFAALSASAHRTTIEATMLPADAAIDQHFRRWITSQELPSTAPVCLAPPDLARIDGLISLLRQARVEERDPEQNLAKRLEGVASSLRDRTDDFTNKRNESIEGLMGNILSEWSSWTMLPLRRRYCPSFHKSPPYRYARLGFTLAEVFDERGAFVQADNIGRLPDSQIIQRKISEYVATWQKVGQRPEGLESKRDEILQLIQAQVEGNKIIGLSASARLHYNMSKRQWQCGLCTHEPRIGGSGSPESHLGCPNQGLFTDAEAAMAEQYVQYEDLLIPMLTNLWNEKSTHDEVNRIVREKEAELRRNVLEEQQSLRDEARIFKEAARDRIVKLEDMRGTAKELIEKFREEVHAAYVPGALDGPRQLELEGQVRDNERQVASIGEISLNARNLEDGLAADVDATLSSRDIVLEERIRRSSDAPQFVHLPPPITRRALLPGNTGFLLSAPTRANDADVLWVRKRGDSSFEKRTIEELSAWLSNASHASADQGLEVSDGKGAWGPLLAHPRLTNGQSRGAGADCSSTSAGFNGAASAAAED